MSTLLPLLYTKNSTNAVLMGMALTEARDKLEAGESQHSPAMDVLARRIREAGHNLSVVTATAHAFLGAADFQTFCHESLIESADAAKQIRNAYLS